MHPIYNFFTSTTRVSPKTELWTVQFKYVAILNLFEVDMIKFANSLA
jgi:hypothetical protein